MSFITVRPDNSVHSFFSAVTLTGGASYHAVTNDNSDASYATNGAQGSIYIIEMDDPEALLSLAPDGAVPSRVRARVRFASAGFVPGKVDISGQLGTTTGFPSSQATTPSTTPTTVALPSFPLLAWPSICNLVVHSMTVPAGATTCRVIELYADLYYVEIPVVSVTGPTGTIDDNNRPFATWANSLDSEGGIQTAYYVKLFTDDAYEGVGFDPEDDSGSQESGELTGSAATWQPPNGLENGDYKFYVKVAQTVNGELFYSEWDAGPEFTIDIDQPGIPDITASGDDEDGRVAIGLVDNPGDATTDYIQVQVQRDEDSEYENIRTLLGDGLIEPSFTPEDSESVWDYEQPNGEQAAYRARAIHDYGEFMAFGDWSNTDTATWSSTDEWLIHPFDPTKNAKVRLGSPATGGVTSEPRQGLFQPSGSDVTIAISDTRAGDTGTMRIRSDVSDEKAEVEALVDAAVPIYYKRVPGDGEKNRWLIFDTHQSTRLVDSSTFHKVWDDIGWTEVPSPPGNMINFDIND